MQSTNDKSSHAINSLLMLIIFISFTLTSPKWNIALAPWVAHTFLLRFFRQNRLRTSILLGWSVTYLAALIASWKVVPFPFPVLLIFSLVSSGIVLIPYLLDKWLNRRVTGWYSTLVFPMAMVCLDYLASKGGGGTWGNIAYLQFSVPYLTQLASITGIWGISFMVYWFASTVNYVLQRIEIEKSIRSAVIIYSVSILLILGFGFYRIQKSIDDSTHQVKMAGITVENLSIFEKIYECETGETIKIPPTAFQSDPAMAKAMLAMQNFVAHPADPKFDPVFEEVDIMMDQLWQHSKEAVEQGARYIVWTEGIVPAIKPDESKYIEKAQSFAQQHNVWLFFPMSTIIPGKVEPGQPFIENKVLSINSSGEIVNVYLKNNPVGGVEPCFPGDGTIPVISTDQAQISPVICYDADFPDLLRNVGQQNTEILIVPSGDWAAISPIHSYMAVFRAIENGVSILRPVSKGLMIAADNYGQVIETDDYFEDDNHSMLAEVPVKKVKTVYSIIGDSFAYFCGLGLAILILLAAFSSRILKPGS